MINKVILIGNVGADPEIRTLESGVKMARIRVATTERIYNREAQESRDHTEWHSVVLWRNLADVADRFIRKGSQVYIEGGGGGPAKKEIKARGGGGRRHKRKGDSRE